MKFQTAIYIITASLSLQLVSLQGQSRKQLEAKRKKAQEEIEYNRRILKQTEAKKNAALHNLNVISEIIVQRQQVIGVLKDELGETEKEIEQRNRNLQELKKAYEDEKLRMRKTVIKAYKTRKNANEMAFVFASASFRQALRRLKYLKKLSEYRYFLIGRIESKRDSVQRGILVLQETKEIKSSLLNTSEKEKKDLEKDKSKKSVLLKTLSSEEKALKKKIRNNEAAIAKLNNAISQLIAREIAEAKKKAKAAEKVAAKKDGSAGKTSGSSGSGKTSGSISLTPEAAALSNSFVSSKGSLPWPVERGYISQGFGVHAHPDLSGISLINNGIDITTASGSSARAVFKGTVSAIINIPGQEKAVLINHGEYYTVYSRLSSVSVSKGQEVSAKQVLGTIWTDDDSKTILQFQVWKGQAKQNPAPWLASK